MAFTSVPALFAAQVAKSPDAIAAVFADQQLSYAALEARANQLAHHLRALGVGPEVVVGLCVERSLPMLVGLLGILKAGGAYLPLDPAYPPQRLAFMLERCPGAGLGHPSHVARSHYRPMGPASFSLTPMGRRLRASPWVRRTAACRPPTPPM